MNRRSFLKLLGSGLVAVVAPPLFVPSTRTIIDQNPHRRPLVDPLCFCHHNVMYRFADNPIEYDGGDRPYFFGNNIIWTGTHHWQY